MPKAGYHANPFVAKNLVFTKYAFENSIEGRVNVQFSVKEDGYLDYARVIRSPPLPSTEKH
jgi:outer membrane biosynthesis protein TonB